MLHIRIIKIHRSLLMLCFLLLISCSTDETDLVGFSTDEVYSISTYVEQNKEVYSKFWQVLETTDLYPSLNAYNPNGNGFSLFLPTDAAFERYIQNNEKYASFEELLNDKAFLNVLIRYHLVNSSLESSDFTYGALSDSTALGDYLSIGLEITEDTSIYKINNVAPLLTADIETTNGFIHVISEVLEPITYSGFDWLKKNEGYSLLVQTLEITGVSELMGVFESGINGALIKNKYTVLAEHDSIFNRAGIYSIDDIIAKYHTEGLDYNDPDDGLYQFAAYHVIDGQYFLDDFEGLKNYNTFAVYPMSVKAGLDIQINNGVDTFATVITETDTSYIQYLSMDLNSSNVNTKNGPVHFITQVLELYEPTRKNIVGDFTNDPEIEGIGYGTHFLYDPSEYEFLYWEGIENIKYVNPANAESDSYLEITGDFTFQYTIPAVLPGEYQVYFRMNSNNAINAVIQVKIDGTRAGGNINLSYGSGAFSDILVGTVNFTGNNNHMIEIKTLIPGRMRWYTVTLIPN